MVREVWWPRRRAITGSSAAYSFHSKRMRAGFSFASLAITVGSLASGSRKPSTREGVNQFLSAVAIRMPGSDFSFARKSRQRRWLRRSSKASARTRTATAAPRDPQPMKMREAQGWPCARSEDTPLARVLPPRGRRNRKGTVATTPAFSFSMRSDRVLQQVRTMPPADPRG